jgi:uncharacterized membrane protein
MRKILFVFWLVSLVGITANPQAASAQNDQPLVQTILFWTEGCPYCTQALTETLPPLQEKYQAQLSILLVEVATVEDIEKLYSLGADLGYTKEQVNVPLLLVDHSALIGVNEIRDRLPDLVDEYLSTGGKEYPDMPQLSEMLSRGVAFTEFDTSTKLLQQAETGNNSLGMALAWVIMVVMILALVLSIVMIVRAFNGKPLGKINRWLDIAIPILSLIGLGASIYLSYVELTHTQALCGPVGDCNAVQSSPYAKLFGILPIGVVGGFGYIAILAAWIWQRFRTDALARIAGPVMFGMALFGTLFSVYLTYLELFVIHAVCLWCLSSAVLITALMLINLPSLTQWVAISDEEE